MPLNPGTYFLAYNVFQNGKNRYRLRMPGISVSTFTPFKVIYLWYYRSISVRIGKGKNGKNGFVEKSELQDI